MADFFLPMLAFGPLVGGFSLGLESHAPFRPTTRGPMSGHGLVAMAPVGAAGAEASAASDHNAEVRITL